MTLEMTLTFEPDDATEKHTRQRARSASGRPSIFYLAHVLWRHRRTQRLALPPRAIQQVVFPVILLLGHIFGKYRGSEWPGSPASCVGAPETVARLVQPDGESSTSLMSVAT
jgi:hypothetical protein